MQNCPFVHYVSPQTEVVEIEAEGVFASSIDDLENSEWN